MATEPDPYVVPPDDLITADMTADMTVEITVEDLVPRLSGAAVRWVDGGSIGRWSPVYGRASRPVALPGQAGRFVLTRAESPTPEGIIQRWLEHQRLLVTAPDTVSPALVFARLAVRQRAFALDVRPRGDVREASDLVRMLTQRASQLRVSLGFFVGESIPAWVVCDEGVPVLVGMPHYHLVPTDDPTLSLAALMSTARIKPQVHEVSS